MTVNNYISSLARSYKVIRREFYCHLCLIVGLIKSRLFFGKHMINKLEIGSGVERKEGFITLDLDLKSDLPFDLRAGIPLSDNSIDLVYAEHVLEHFDYKDMTDLLNNCYRILKSGGIFSIVVPDAEIYLKGYFNPENFEYKKYCRVDTGLTYQTKIDYLNYIFYMGGHHRHMFDKDNIVTVLSEAGFKEIHFRDFDPSLDNAGRKYESIYIECEK